MATNCEDNETEIISTAPRTIQFDTGTGDEGEALFSIDTHPTNNILATGDITGNIKLYSYTSEQPCGILRNFTSPDSGSCRVLKFSSNGKRLFSGMALKEVLVTDVESGKLIKSIRKAHGASLYSMLTISEGVLATGDEQGEIKIWDTRSWKSTFRLRENHDFISGMVVDDGKRTLLATSGDGCLTAIDLRQRQLEQQSDRNESELLSIALVKGGKKVVCGDGEGALMIYNWGLWGDITDRFPSHSQSIDSLVAINDSVVCTGCMDSVIRSVQILPNQILGEVGQHAESIDNMCLTYDRQFLVTSSQDSCNFWPATDIPTLTEESSGKMKRSRVNRNEASVKRKQRKKQKKQDCDSSDRQDFFSDLLNT